jgi:2,4-dienoyl-CoA reductase (NADPH2)
MGSMHTGLEEMGPEGFARMAAYYAERARGGVGMIITGGNAPNDAAALAPGEYGAFNRDEHVPLHRQVTDAVHAAAPDCKICLQILHAGNLAYSADPVAPSPIASPINPREPREMSAEDIESTIADFVRCAERARAAGYDGVEIIGSAGYLLSTFLLEKTNQRHDEWGGSYENRMRFPVEIVRRTREALGPDFIADLPHCRHGADGGRQQLGRGRHPGEGHRGRRRNDHEHALRLAPGPGADDLHPRTARGVHRRDRAPAPRAVDPDDHQQPHQHARGGGEGARRRRCGHHLHGPADAGGLAVRAQGLRGPGGRDQHLHRLQPGLPGSRLSRQDRVLPGQSPGLPRDRTQLPAHGSSEAHRGGRRRPRGLAFATTAAERGHAVTLFEASDELGGHFNLAMRIPGKEEFAETIRYYRRQLELNGVTVRIG